LSLTCLAAHDATRRLSGYGASIAAAMARMEMDGDARVVGAMAVIGIAGFTESSLLAKWNSLQTTLCGKER
jgi:hypothetical protein